MKIAYVREVFPRLSETFILEEVRALVDAGHDVRVLAARGEHERVQPRFLEANLYERVDYLEAPSLWRRIDALARLPVRLALRPRYRERWLAPLARPGPPLSLVGLARALEHSARVHNASLALGQQRRAAAPFTPDVIYAPFSWAWDVAMMAPLRRRWPGVPHVMGLRAKDLYTLDADGRSTLAAQAVREAAGLVTISRFNAEVVRARAAESGRPLEDGALAVVHSAIDTRVFVPDPAVTPEPDLIVAVARFVLKKGLDVLIDALALLRARDVRARLVLVGDGGQRAAIVARARAAGVADAITLAGACTQAEVRAWLARAAVVALPCVVPRDGDRDILPNSLKEAMAMARPVVTSEVSGIDELVRDGVEGLLVPPGSPAALADAITRVLADPALGRRLGQAGRSRVVAAFDARGQAALLAAHLGRVAARARRA